MEHPTLQGRSILIVEDNALIVMDITMAFENTGASLTTTHTLKHALLLAEHDGLSGAILDHALEDGDSSLLCKRLTERGIPFMIYSGYPKSKDASDDLVHVSKPATHEVIVAAMEGLIRRSEIANLRSLPPVRQEKRGDAAASPRYAGHRHHHRDFAPNAANYLRLIPSDLLQRLTRR